ncbi:MAG: alpha/beta hydrolase family protein [Bradymonadia bacterium]
MRWCVLPALVLAPALILGGCDDGADPDDDAPTSDAGASDAATPDGEQMADADVMPEADEGVIPEPDPVNLMAPGTFEVGFTEFEVTYQLPREDAPRTLRTVAWYPTEATEGNSTRYASLIRADGIFTDAPPAIDGEAPTLIFSHGNGGIAEQSFFLSEFMASHGWVVVAFDHTGNAFRSDGREVYEMFELRPLDVSAVIDAVQDLPEDHLLAGAVGPEVMLAGHSFGGYTSLAVGGATFDVDALSAGCMLISEEFCDYFETVADVFREGFLDERVVATVPMTPVGATVFSGGTAAIDIPTLMMTGGKDATLPDEMEGDPLWAAMDGPNAIRLSFPDAGHFTFSNACDIFPTLIMNDGCEPEFIPPEEAYEIINAYTLAFGRFYMLGDDSMLPLLTGEELIGEGDVEFFTKP